MEGILPKIKIPASTMVIAAARRIWFSPDGRNQHFINGQRSGQRSNQKQGEENHCEHGACPHIGEHDRQALEHQCGPELGATPKLKRDGKIIKPANTAIKVLVIAVITAV